MERENLLQGRWLFTAMESYSAGAWHRSSDIGDIAWCFAPSESDSTSGVVTEYNKWGLESSLRYSYDAAAQLLKIDIYPIGSAEQELHRVEIVAADIITISILNDPDFPPPYLRYTLRRIEG